MSVTAAWPSRSAVSTHCYDMVWCTPAVQVNSSAHKDLVTVLRKGCHLIVYIIPPYHSTHHAWSCFTRSIHVL